MKTPDTMEEREPKERGQFGQGLPQNLDVVRNWTLQCE